MLKKFISQEEALGKGVEMYSTFKPLFNNNKIFYIPFTAAPLINTRYYLNDYPEIDGKKIRGIDFYSNVIAINTVVVNGVVYDLISNVDIAKVQVTFVDKNNLPILYRVPLAFFYKMLTTVNTQSLELNDFADLDIDCGKSYFEFTGTFWFGAFPMVIPLKFVW